MRNVIIGLGIAAMALTAGIQASHAQTNSPFGKRQFCWSGDKSNGGMPECAFYTWAQCEMNLQGGGGHCFENPTYGWDRPQGNQKRQQKRSY